jgi:hypothetical protein
MRKQREQKMMLEQQCPEHVSSQSRVPVPSLLKIRLEQQVPLAKLELQREQMLNLGGIPIFSLDRTHEQQQVQSVMLERQQQQHLSNLRATERLLSQHQQHMSNL